ncbi:AvaI/BsoBI family type II restriction endonuclease [Yersinia enterocolitica]|uniref:AvaI/BsoBI family type II restriction endonuclease n=1 Tax=Yersinia enterocolitica TaxID=630 RepID=UPI003D052D28
MESVSKPEDLITTVENRIDGFSWQASQKLEKADPFIGLADYAIKNLHTVHNVESLRKDARLTEFIIAACMLSKKSLSHLNAEIQNNIIEELINFNNFTDINYVRELERRYFLTCGDSLGGSMRNAVGQNAQQLLSKSIIVRLSSKGYDPKLVFRKEKLVEIKWENRRIFFDQKPKFIGKSVDFIVVGGESARVGSLEAPVDFICCGELKGGIDPAGADEHWKTAKTALERINTVFQEKAVKPPKLIFIGAAIESAMSYEIFKLLEVGWLAGAANILKEEQLHEVIDIITS